MITECGSEFYNRFLVTPLFQRLRARLPAKAWQVIADSDPLRPIREVVMRLRIAIDLAGQVGQGDVDIARVMGRFTEQRATAAVAKGSPPVLRGVMDGQVLTPRDQAKLCIRHADPGDIASTMDALTHRTMAMGAEKSRQRHLKRHGPTET